MQTINISIATASLPVRYKVTRAEGAMTASVVFSFSGQAQHLQKNTHISVCLEPIHGFQRVCVTIIYVLLFKRAHGHGHTHNGDSSFAAFDDGHRTRHPRCSSRCSHCRGPGPHGTHCCHLCGAWGCRRHGGATSLPPSNPASTAVAVVLTEAFQAATVVALVPSRFLLRTLRRPPCSSSSLNSCCHPASRGVYHHHDHHRRSGDGDRPYQDLGPRRNQRPAFLVTHKSRGGLKKSQTSTSKNTEMKGSVLLPELLPNIFSQALLVFVTPDWSQTRH